MITMNHQTESNWERIGMTRIKNIFEESIAVKE